MVRKNQKILFMVIKTERKKLSSARVRVLARKLKKNLLQEGMPVRELFLFGSYATGRPHLDSDIDVAVIVPSGMTVREQKKAQQITWLTKQTNVKFEPHIFSERDFNNRWLSLPAEIKKHGVKIR